MSEAHLPREKNPKRVEAGKKGAYIRKFKKEQREKDQQIETVTYQNKSALGTTSSSSEHLPIENPITYTRVEKHGNIFNHIILGLTIISVGCLAYSKYQENKIIKSQGHLCCPKKPEKINTYLPEEKASSTYNVLDMK